jgi:hypothetical protein
MEVPVIALIMAIGLPLLMAWLAWSDDSGRGHGHGVH